MLKSPMLLLSSLKMHPVPRRRQSTRHKTMHFSHVISHVISAMNLERPLPLFANQSLGIPSTHPTCPCIRLRDMDTVSCGHKASGGISCEMPAPDSQSPLAGPTTQRHLLTLPLSSLYHAYCSIASCQFTINEYVMLCYMRRR